MRGPVLVTGGGGFLGRAIVRRLREAGIAVRTFSRSRYPELEELGAEQIRGDLGDADAAAAACAGMTTVFHTAAKAGVWGPPDAYHRANTAGTEHIIAGCRAAGARLIHTSSPSVIFSGTDIRGGDEHLPYSSHFSTHYPRTKALAEQAVRRAALEGLSCLILRPHLIWGPEDPHLVPRVLARGRRLRIIGDGANKVDTIYIDNAADAHLLAAMALSEKPELSGRVYFVSQGEPVNLWEMLNRILAAGGQPPVTRHIPVTAARWIGAALEGVWGIFRLPGEPFLTRFVAEELSTSHWFDISAARRDLGYVPAVSTDEGLARLAKWLDEIRAA
ncbi:MAG: 3-beta hydroxysteroid dehydrogenase [Desulfobacterales bacterium]|nr:MAG: 3-beta hydroxysteroid dehydrogenase [Desulfobacterales bacterium]